MTHHIKATRRIDAPADDLWSTISRMSGMEDWYPELIRESTLFDADSAQPRRVCILRDGGELKERILLRDAPSRTFVYAIDSHPMPARNVVGTLRIDEDTPGRSHVTWSAQMVLDPATARDVASTVEGMYAAGLVALEAHHLKASDA